MHFISYLSLVVHKRRSSHTHHRKRLREKKDRNIINELMTKKLKKNVEDIMIIIFYNILQQKYEWWSLDLQTQDAIIKVKAYSFLDN